MIRSPDVPPAVPSWIDGRAYLAVPSRFTEVRERGVGQVLRRSPLGGAHEAARAVESAQKALTDWAVVSITDRIAMLKQLADSLDTYAEHLAGLLVEESGWTEEGARADVSEAATCLREARPSGQIGVVAIGIDSSPLLHDWLPQVVGPLLAGASVIVKPDPRAPSVTVAFAELTARTGLPAGVFNVLQGDAQTLAALRAHPGITVVTAGQPPSATSVGDTGKVERE